MFQYLAWRIDIFFARIEVKCFELNKHDGNVVDYLNANKELRRLESAGVEAGWLEDEQRTIGK